MVVDQQDADPHAFHVAHELGEPLHLGLGKARGRFVEENGDRFGQQRPADIREPAVAIRERLELPVGHFSEVDQPDHRFDLGQETRLLGGRGRQAQSCREARLPHEAVRPEHQVLAHGEVRHEARILEGADQARLRDLVVWPAGDIVPHEGDAAAAWPIDAAYDVDQR